MLDLILRAGRPSWRGAELRPTPLSAFCIAVAGLVGCAPAPAGSATDDEPHGASLDDPATNLDGTGAGGSTNGAPSGGSASGGGSGIPDCATGDPTCEEPPLEPPPAGGEFELLWEDQFDSFDEARWRRHDHTFAENAAYFSQDNVRVAGGKLQLHLNQKSNFDPNNPDDKPYLGAEVSTHELFTYLRITASIRFAQGQGVVSSLFTFADNANSFWNEIDVEYLGYQEQHVQYNLITSACGTCGADRIAVPYPDFIGVSPYSDFYEYQITWTPGEVSFSVNGIPRWSESSPDMTAPARIRMNVWPTSGLDPFAGTLDPDDLPTFAEYDWIRVEQYTGD